MGESRREAELDRALRALGPELGYPPTPPLVEAVTSRIRTREATGARPAFPWLPLWSRRRLLVAVAVGLLALLGVAAAARFVLGAAEIRIQPGASPTGAPPLGPGGLGRSVPPTDLEAAVGFEVRLPAGPAPDEAYVFHGPSGADGALLAWRASERFPALTGTPWGLVLMQVRGDENVVLKTTGQAEDVRVVRVDGHRAFWLTEPHVLDVRTADGYRAFSVDGNVLIWAVDAVTYRLETSLGLDDALAVAASIR